MRAIAANLQAKPKPGDDRNDTGRILAAEPDVVGHFEIGGRLRALSLKGRYRLAGMRMWLSIPTPIVWPGAWELLAKGKVHLSDATDVGPAGAGPKILRAKDARWVLLRDPKTGTLHYVLVAHLCPEPQLNDKRARLWAQQMDGLTAALVKAKADNPGVVRHLLADLNQNDRAKLTQLEDIGMHLGRRTLDHGRHQLQYVASDLDGDRTLIQHVRTDHKPVLADLKEAPVTTTPHGFMPGIIHKPIAPGSNDPEITPVGGVLHVRDGLGDSLHDFFDGPSGGIESHFYVRFTGVIEQYRSIYFEADANLDGNSFLRGGKRCGLLSIETEGKAAGTWTPEQLASIKQIITWANDEADVPIQVIDRWDGDGWGYHTMWGSPSHWTPKIKTCPGPGRIVQCKDVMFPWLAAGGDTEPRPTLVEQMRELGAKALERANRTGRTQRAARIQAGLDALPEK